MNTRLFGPDPIDFLDPSPYSPLEYYGHLLIGAIWFFAGLTALASIKGSRIHVLAGKICIYSVLLIAFTSVVMLAVEFVPPLALNAITASYAVLTGWLALKPARGNVRRYEIALSVIEALALAAFLAIALPNVLAGNVALIGPGIVVLVPTILLAGDVNWHLRQKKRPALRVRRHLARMVWAFVIVLRAPLVEFETAGFFDLPDPVLIIGPVLLGLALLAYFQSRGSRPRPVRPQAMKA